MRPHSDPYVPIRFGSARPDTVGSVMGRRPPDPQQGPGFFDGSEEPAVPASGRRLIIEADGGSRGNPGSAAYGALIRDPETAQVLAAEGLPIGRATHN